MSTVAPSPTAARPGEFSESPGWASESALVTAAVKWLRGLGLDAHDTSLAYLVGGLAPDIGAMDAGGKLWTIEAKMHNWRRALSQAHGHQCAADYAYVLMPRIVRGMTMKPFRRAGVGFILWSTRHGFRSILRARQAQPSALFGKHYRSHFWPNDPAQTRRAEGARI